MKIAIFGATGRVGQRVMDYALENQFEVRALVRSHHHMKETPNVEWIYGDAKNAEDVNTTIEGCDLVFSGLSTDKSDTLSQSIPNIIDAMVSEDIQRIVTIGTAGILNSRGEPNKFRFQTSESKKKLTFAAEEHAKVYQALSASHLEWTIVCPTYLPDGDIEGSIRCEKNFLPEDGKKITVGDTAKFAYQELFDKNYVGSRVGVCY
ncbi:NAD(P)H-binding protein [Halobacillus locisalis]|uniref:NAD(P)H-binding protein n=1 Tax=Halobacillus locisalis TaxID=220753 RepID=A0A838CR33_9BACI|nr:NAD(P)H-binding protein [Halobacillus locisalis]MBA2174592.1 NAD(P)H-binding protein [Halobacillus locisalis]